MNLDECMCICCWIVIGHTEDYCSFACVTAHTARLPVVCYCLSKGTNRHIQRIGYSAHLSEVVNRKLAERFAISKQKGY